MYHSTRKIDLFTKPGECCNRQAKCVQSKKKNAGKCFVYLNFGVQFGNLSYMTLAVSSILSSQFGDTGREMTASGNTVNGRRNVNCSDQTAPVYLTIQHVKDLTTILIIDANIPINLAGIKTDLFYPYI